MFNLYYEMPEGGGNLSFTDKDSAVSEFNELLLMYPDSYLCVTDLNRDDRSKIVEFIPDRYR